MTSLRSQIEGFRGNSFENISAYGANAALPHYCTQRENSPVIKPRGLYLIDTGGQFTFGTTDTTRTVPLGRCSRLEREDYTLVLKPAARSTHWLAVRFGPPVATSATAQAMASDSISESTKGRRASARISMRSPCSPV